MAVNIIVILGASKSGKDTLAKVLPAHNVKFATPVKRAVERAKGLLPGCIDAPKPHHNCKDKVIDLLVESYDKAGWVQKNLWIPQMTGVASDILARGESVSFTDVRRTEERDAILYLRGIHHAKLTAIHVTRPGQEEYKPSDANLLYLVHDFRSVADTFYRFVNDDTVQRLQNKANYVTMLLS